jgi:hypothetical protein
MDAPAPADVIRRLESLRSSTELTTSVLSVALQLMALAGLVRPLGEGVDADLHRALRCTTGSRQPTNSPHRQSRWYRSRSQSS